MLCKTRVLLSTTRNVSTEKITRKKYEPRLFFFLGLFFYARLRRSRELTRSVRIKDTNIPYGGEGCFVTFPLIYFIVYKVYPTRAAAKFWVVVVIDCRGRSYTNEWMTLWRDVNKRRQFYYTRSRSSDRDHYVMPKSAYANTPAI